MGEMLYDICLLFCPVSVFVFCRDAKQTYTITALEAITLNRTRKDVLCESDQPF